MASVAIRDEDAATLDAVRAEVFALVFRRPPDLTVSEWADRYRMLPATSAVRGRFRTDFLPYMRRIMNVLGNRSARKVVFAKGSQVAGSTVGENFLGYLIDQDPCGILVVWPTEKKLRTWATTRLDPMIADCEPLRAKFPRSGRRDASDSMERKLFDGGYLRSVTAKSTSDLKSDSARSSPRAWG